MHPRPCSLFIGLVTAAVGALAAAQVGPLPAFADPPVENRAKFRYWLPDADVDHEVVRDDVRALKDLGAGGLEFLPFYNYGFGGLNVREYDRYAFGKPAFVDVLTTALETCKAVGLHMDVALGASQGQGVPSEPLTTGLAVQLVYGSATVKGGEQFSGPLPSPNLDWNEDTTFMQRQERFGGSKLIGVSAGAVTFTNQTGTDTYTKALAEESLVDLSSEVENGQLTWHAPTDSDEYVVFATYQRYTNQRSCVGIPTDVIANGSWVTDKFSAAGAQLVSEFWEQNILTSEVRELLQAVGQHTWEDSMEIQASLYWSESLLERFETNRGYSPIKYLPLLFDKSTSFGSNAAPYDTTYLLAGSSDNGQNQYLQDYRTTLNEGYIEYLQTVEAWAQSIGLSHSCQVAYNVPVDMMAAVPYVSGPELESLAFPSADIMLQFVGAAHLSRRNIISTEVGAIQTGGYSMAVPSLINLFHEAFSSGVNLMVIHGMPYGGEQAGATWPGFTPFQYVYSEMWSPRQPAWAYLDEQIEYTGRTQLVLQAGVAKRDISFYLYKDPYTLTVERDGADLRGAGFTYEYLSPSNLVDENVVVADGLLDADGPGYRALVLDRQEYITVASAQKLVEYVEAGLAVVVIGALPSKAIGSGDQAAVTETMATLRGAGHANLVVIDSIDSLVQTLTDVAVVPRVQVSSDTAGAASAFYHVLRSSREDEAEYLFVRNKGEAATFRLSIEAGENQVPYKLDAWTGQQEAIAVYERSEGRVHLQVTLQAGQTGLLALGPSSAALPAEHVVGHSDNVVDVEYDVDSNRLVVVVGDVQEATVTLSNGESVQIPALAGADNTAALAEVGITGWNLTVQSWVPSSGTNATSQSAKVDIDLGVQDTLRPWSEIPAVQNVSGVGFYTATFATPASLTQDTSNYTTTMGTVINFGPVLNTLRAWVNDKQLPPIDIYDAQVDISDYIDPQPDAVNSVRVEVSSTLFNAVKARVGTNYVKTNGFGPSVPQLYTAAPLQQHGLVGPVKVSTLRRVAIR